MYPLKRDKLTNKLFDSLNKLNNNDYNVGITKSSNGLLETLNIIKNCNFCKDKYVVYKFHKSTNEIESHLVKLVKEEQGKEDIINQLNAELVKMDSELNN